MNGIQLTKRRLSFYVRRMSPAKLVSIGYATYVLVGWLVLCLPISTTRDGLNPLDHLFTAASAVSTTGLVTLDTGADYSFFGQVVICLLIQAGGLGYMTFGSFVILSRGADLSAHREQVGKTVFALPESFRVAPFIRRVIAFTLIIEAIGAVVLWREFSVQGEDGAAWSGLFHSVSAFCTAGFGLYNTSFESYSRDFGLNAAISILSLLGAIGYIVLADIWDVVVGRKRYTTLTTRVILVTTFGLLSLSTVILLFTEHDWRGEAPHVHLMTAFFQSMTALTTVGFNTANIGAMSMPAVWLLLLLMAIGASPSGTGGGIKCTTVSALYAIVRSAMRGETRVTFWSHPIPLIRLRAAVSAFCFYALTLFAGVFCLLFLESAPFEDLLFEATSALGTVGLSRGVTAELSPLGKLVIIGLMFAGRIGPLTLAIALLSGGSKAPRTADNDLAV